MKSYRKQKEVEDKIPLGTITMNDKIETRNVKKNLHPYNVRQLNKITNTYYCLCPCLWL